MALFKNLNLSETKPAPKKEKSGSKIKLKKGETISSLIETAKKLVEEKLGNYKDASKCITNLDDLKTFFDNTPEDAPIGIDTETTGLNFFTDKIVGFSICNGKDCLYIPINHKSALYNMKLKGQIPEDDLRNYLKELNRTRHFNWIFHNYKFDAGVFRTFLGEDWPDPYWDTMIAANIFKQDEDHGLKYLYNTYVAEEDEGVNRFDNLFKGVTFDYIPLDIATVYAGKDALITYELYEYQKKKFEEPDSAGMKYVFEQIEVPLMPILAKMNRDGINMNMGMLKELKDKYEARLEIAKTKVYEEIKPYEKDIEEFRIKHYNKKLDSPISISSPSQLSILFYDIIGYKTKEGRGTGVKELERINTPLTKALIEYRKMEKLIDAFLVALPKQIEPSTGKIHTTLNQYGAATGRFSSSNPRRKLGHIEVILYENHVNSGEAIA